jgi:hypothetical protein
MQDIPHPTSGISAKPDTTSTTRHSTSIKPAHFEETCKLHTTSTVVQLGRILMARARIMTIVKSDIVLSIIISIFARRVSGKASVGLKAVAVLYPRYR